jgi:hypothetical protein
MLVPRPVRGDGTVHQRGIDLEQGTGVDAEPLRYTGRIALQQHVGGGGEPEELRPAGAASEVKSQGPLAAVPHPGAWQPAERAAAGAVNPGDLRAMIGEDHSGHRPGDPAGEIQDPKVSERPAHR